VYVYMYCMWCFLAVTHQYQYKQTVGMYWKACLLGLLFDPEDGGGTKFAGLHVDTSDHIISCISYLILFH
jgi:hypothetical protein